MRKPIFYSPPRPRKLEVTPAPMAKPVKEAEGPHIIQGQEAGSDLEWNVAQALGILELKFIYQYQIGFAKALGSQTIDFLVFTPGMATPLQVHGRYWHTGTHADELDDMKIVQLMGGQVRKPVIIWEENCTTVNDAVAFLRQNLAIG